ncbi:MAG: hypothetical protein JW776_07515 [Candidatus Lokiarchaeota archaeon]|nr:hypothetical protein [Candidatus Lokiarchaeota archaeon]
MTKKTQRSFLAIIGGIAALLGVVLSIFIKELGWWNFLTVLGNEVTDNDYLSAFFGDGDPYFSDTFTYLLPGIIAGVGALLCLPGNKILSLLGSVLVLVGVGVFFVLLGDSEAAVWASYIDTNIFWDSAGITIGDSFTGVRWRLGIGLFMTAGGGIIGLIGALTSKK